MFENKVITLLWIVGIFTVLLDGTSYVGEAETITYMINQSLAATFVDSGMPTYVGQQ